MQQHLSSIELKYGDDLMAAKALHVRPPVIHDEPDLVITSASPAEKKKEKKDDEAAVLRAAPITLTDTGEVGGVVAACPSVVLSAASGSTDLGAPASTSSGSGGPSSGVASGGVPPSAADGRLKPYDIRKDSCTSLSFPLVDDFGIKLFMSMGEEHLLAAYVDCLGPVDKHVKVQYVEASDPMIWMARCVSDAPPESLVLVPWTSPLVRIVEDTKEHPDGLLLESIKRPKHLFAGLPLVATVLVACGDVDESVLLAARSPLSGKQTHSLAPPAFWCVLEADDGEEERANMVMRYATMEFKSAPISIAERPRKRRRDPKLQVTFPILVNVKPLKEGDVLVFPRGTNFQSTGASTGAAEETDLSAPQQPKAKAGFSSLPFT